MMERPVFPSDDGPEPRCAPDQSPSRPADRARDPRFPGLKPGSVLDETHLRGLGGVLSTEKAAAPTDPRIDAYLDEVFAPLAGRLPPVRTQELRVELASHLEALVEARRELGSEPDAAVRAALQQLGNARRLGRVWARECRRPGNAPPFHATAPLGSILFAGLTLLAAGSLGASLLIGLEQHLGHNLFELALGGPMLPLAAGAMVGFSRGRHPLGSRWGLLLIALAGAAISLLMTTADPRPPLVLVIRALLWLMTACASAGLGALTASAKELMDTRAATL